MWGSCKPGLTTTLLERTGSFFRRLGAFDRICGWARKKPKRFSSSFDPLTLSFAASKVSSQFEEVFKVFDANGDGKISIYELSEVLCSLGYDKSRAAKDAEVMVREIDCNGDGFIDLEEFLDAMKSDGKFWTGCGEEDDHLKDAFLIFDADKNGLISAKELRRVLVNLGCEKCSLQACRRMIKGVDKNGDGFVDFDEFRSMMMKGRVC